MFIKIKNQEDIIRKAIAKAGSYRALSKKLKIPCSSIARYINGEALPEDRFNSIVKFLNINNPQELCWEKLPNNFRQKIGGIRCVESKKKKGTFIRDMERIQKISSEKLKKWHKHMKENNPEEYYTIQYSRFKKIGGYKCKTDRGEIVRNILEKQIADILYKLKLDYQYEPLVRINKKFFFPDFLINNKIIVECTMWKGQDKAHKLKRKIKHLRENYSVFVVIPKSLNKVYSLIESSLILGLDEFASVAQTFSNVKT